MVFLTGARQVGKTWLSQKVSPAYFNWDTPEVKKAYLKDPYFYRSENKIVVFDESHRRKDWKKILKGYYDSPSRQENFIITGSGRFDQYQRGGDSLQGRYDSYKLWPFSYDEISKGEAHLAQLSKPRDWCDLFLRRSIKKHL
jgi:predicted AAA+ superfamily ATPase